MPKGVKPLAFFTKEFSTTDIDTYRTKVSEFQEFVEEMAQGYPGSRVTLEVTIHKPETAPKNTTAKKPVAKAPVE